METPIIFWNPIMINLGFLVGGASIEHDFTFKTLQYLLSHIVLSEGHHFCVKRIYYISPDNNLYIVDEKYIRPDLTPELIKTYGKKSDYTSLAGHIKNDQV